MAIQLSRLSTVLANPTYSIQALDKFESEKSLINFIKLGWHTLEPGNPLVYNWGMEAICDHLEAVTRGDIRRLLINIPPGTSKSLTTNVFWPAWEWGPKKLPHLRYLNVAHAENLAIRDNRRCKMLINSDWYQSLWGDRFGFSRDQNQKANYENTRTGFRVSCPADSLTGKRGDRVIYDDPHSVSKAESDAIREGVLTSFSEELPTRLNKATESAIVVIMQRVHERDVSGLILSQDLGYEHLMIPMEFESDRRCYSTVKPSYMKSEKTKVYYNTDTFSWQKQKPEKSTNLEIKQQERYNVDLRQNDGDLLDPKRFPQFTIDELKKTLRAKGGTYAEVGQLQQRPAPRGGGMFQRDDFKYLDSSKGLKFKKIVRGWDLAASDKNNSPFTVGCKIGMTIDKNLVILDIYRVQHATGKLERGIKSVVEADGKTVIQDFPQDPGQAGKVQKTAFAQLLHGFSLKFSPESGSKENRAAPLASQSEGGNLYLIRAPWNDAFISEACVFPNGQFKDQIDAASRSYGSLLSKKRRGVGGAPQTVGE